MLINKYACTITNVAKLVSYRTLAESSQCEKIWKKWGLIIQFRLLHNQVVRKKVKVEETSEACDWLVLPNRGTAHQHIAAKHRGKPGIEPV